jgi:hypothetical protein
MIFGPQIFTKAGSRATSTTLRYRYFKTLTIVIESQGLIDYIEVVQVQLDLEIRKAKVELIIHRNEVMKVTGWTRVPVFRQVADKSGMIPKQECPNLIQVDVERPVSPSIPLQRRWHLGVDLKSEVSLARRLTHMVRTEQLFASSHSVWFTLEVTRILVSSSRSSAWNPDFFAVNGTV